MSFDKYFVVGLVFAVLQSCDDDRIELPPYERKVVVEGYIEQGKFPIVYLTFSSDYYESVDSAELETLILSTARVAVSDGEEEEVLTLFKNTDRFPPFFYAGTDLRGEAGKQYALNVRSRGQEYTATATIPEPVTLDSIYYQPDETAEKGTINITFNDPPGMGNHYRIFTQVVGQDRTYSPAFQSVLSDNLFEGETFTFGILKGVKTLREDVFFYSGDTVNIRFCTMDTPHFDFWRTLERESHFAGNPFASAGNEIISNIEGTKPALGVWGGYGATYYRLVIE